MLSHRFDGKPTWYILSSKSWGNTTRKYGVTKHISKRKEPYITTNPDKVLYEHVFLLSQEDLDRKGISLYYLDSHFFPRWLEGRGLGHLQCCRGGGTEFYDHDNHYELVVEFFDSMGIRVLDETSNDDEFPLFTSHIKTAKSSWRLYIRNEDILHEDSLVEIDTLLSSHTPLLEKFIEVFLPKGVLRPYQRELWDIWCNQVRVPGGYRGILQWPTGSGKTFAELMLLIITSNVFASRGDVYRAIIIAPTNDILNTQRKHIYKLKEFGISVFEGHEGQLSSLTLPHDKPFVLITTHASLTKVSVLASLPPINHIHYDEVHRITGTELFINLTEWIPKWETQYLTGTSATPLTSNPIQREKLSKLFGRDFPTIHRVDIDTLVRLGYIAKPKIHTRVIQNGTEDILVHQVVKYAVEIVKQRQKLGLWKGGKAIVYLPTLEQVCLAYDIAGKLFPEHWKRYMAMDSAPCAHHDKDFVADPADDTPRILFACEKYREGSDIPGIEFTMPLMGKTMSAYIFIQVMGRALRPDYEGKEGWCCILRPQYEDETPEDVLEQIILNITAFLAIRSTSIIPKKKMIRRIVEVFIGGIVVGDKVLDVEETTRRIQSLYIRKSMITFDKMKLLNRELGLTCRSDYEEISDEHPHYIANPQEYYKDVWTNWYDFLGVNTSNWPSTKDEWKSACIERGLTTWTMYREKRQEDLPPNPTEIYSDFTSWRNEFPENYDNDEWL